MSEEAAADSGRSRRARGAWARAEFALGILALFCPLAIGTVHFPSIVAAATLALLALALAAFACYRSGEPFDLPSPAPIFLLVTGVIALQLLPLPPALLGLVSPHTRELFEFVLGPLGGYPEWRPLSLDPPATARELAKAITLLAAFLAAAQISRSRRARRRMVLVLGCAGLAVSLIGFGHALVGATSLFGVYGYLARPPFLTTFGNPNHLASLLALSATALLAVILSEKDRKVATLWGFAYLAVAVGVLLSLSRGGIVAFLFAQALTGLAMTTREPLAGGDRKGLLLIPAAVLVVLGIAGYLAWDALSGELQSADTLQKLSSSKIALWPSFLPLVREHLLAGVGRGAFESAFQRFQPGGLGATLTHPENLVFQWIGELGLPLGLLLLLGCAAALLRALGRPQPQIEQVACLAAVAGVALHDLVDFGMEFAGVAVPTSIALALGVAGGEGVRRTSRRVALLATGALGLVTALALVAGRADLGSEGAALTKLEAGGAAAVAEQAARIARRHPADYLPQLVAARAFAAERPLHADKLFGFANRAMYLNPAHPLPHRLAAQALLAIRQRSQAQLEYRLSWDGEPALVQELARSFQTPADLLAALPDSENAVLMMMSTLEGLGRAVDAQQVGELSVARIGEREAVLSRLANLALARRDAAAADLLGERMTSVAKDRPAGVLARASARVVRGDLDDAIRLLETEGLTSYGRFPDVLLRLAELRLQKKDAKGTREALRRLSPGLDRGMRVRSLSLEAASYEQDGLSTKAAASIKTAMLVQPEDPSLRLRHAQLLEQTGRLDEALSEIEPLAANPSLKQQIGAMKDRIVARRKERSELEHWKDASPTEPAPR